MVKEFSRFIGNFRSVIESIATIASSDTAVSILIFSRLITSGQRPNVNAEQVVWQLVKLFAAHDDPTLKTKVGRLAKTLAEYQPNFHNMLATRKKALEQAVQGKLNDTLH